MELIRGLPLSNSGHIGYQQFHDILREACCGPMTHFLIVGEIQVGVLDWFESCIMQRLYCRHLAGDTGFVIQVP